MQKPPFLCLVCPKNVISRAYPDYVKTDKIDGLVVVSEAPKPIHHEDKVVVVFSHPPKGDQAEEFDCWALHQFVHVTEEGSEEGLFSASNGGGDINSAPEEATQPAPNNTEKNPNKPKESSQQKWQPFWTLQAPQSMTVMLISSGIFFLAWLMMTTNHCQRTFQQKKSKVNPTNHSSSWDVVEFWGLPP